MSFNNGKDYVNIYESAEDDKGIYNTNIYRIQAKYSSYDVEQSDTSATGTTKMYTGSTLNKLLIKIIYAIKSDLDTPTTHSFDDATSITTTPTSSGAKLSTSFNYIVGNDDFYKMTVNSYNKIRVSLYDFMEISRKNYSLTLAVWKEETVDNVTTRTIYKEATTISSLYIISFTRNR